MTNGNNGDVHFKMHDCKMVRIDAGGGICDQCGKDREEVLLEDSSSLWDCLNRKCLEKRYVETYRKFIYRQSYTEPGKFLCSEDVSFWPIGYLLALSKISYFKKVKISDLNDPRFYMIKHAFSQIMQGKKRGIRIYSKEKGVGKTHAMVAFIKHLYYSFRDLPEFSSDIAFVREVDLFSELQAAFNKEDTTAADVLNKYKTARYLFIDDFGSAFKSNEGKWAQQIYYDLFDYRWANTGKLILNTNLSETELEEYLDERVFDRFKDWPLLTVKAPEGGSKRGEF